jgi:UDP-N-acetylglucosamine--N-acetylmuramyl-(pentapeptide) pyrophosphoryl-undecaprenol N-acetylglucosamine transferase
VEPIQKKKIIIAGGGTGGHIYPGVAIARAMERLHPDVEVHFVGARGGLEEKIIPREKFPLHTVPIGQLHHSVGVLTRLKTVLKMPLAFLRAVKILRELSPVAVLGVGGFASGPMLFVASLFGYRTLIWEPNAYPGLTNRLLASRVNECLLVFQRAGEYLKARKITQSGLPVRATIIPSPRHVAQQSAQNYEQNYEQSLAASSVSGSRFQVLVFGGSQGARFINNLVCEAITSGDGSWLSGINFVLQTGSFDYQRLKAQIEQASAQVRAHVQVFEYLHDMDQRYQVADLVICRSGASTVAEICACEKAAIFIPLPTAADDHQRKNAEVLVSEGAALMLEQSSATPEKLREMICQLRDHPEMIEDLQSKIKKFQFPGAAEKIVERLLACD